MCYVIQSVILASYACIHCSFFTFTSYDHDYVITSVKVIYSGCYLIDCWIGAQHAEYLFILCVECPSSFGL